MSTVEKPVVLEVTDWNKAIRKAFSAGIFFRRLSFSKSRNKRVPPMMRIVVVMITSFV